MNLEQYMQDNFLNARMFGEKSGVSWQRIRKIVRYEALITPAIAHKIVSATDGEVTIKDLKEMNALHLKTW